MEKEELQKYWDACLIKTWRNGGTFVEANRMFFSIVKMWPDKCGVELLRYPHFFFPSTAQIRYYVSAFLPKISDWLWAHSPEKDVELLRRVTKSKYDVQKKTLTEDEKERAKVAKQGKKDRGATAVTIGVLANKNHDTDWGVVKGARSRTKRSR